MSDACDLLVTGAKGQLLFEQSVDRGYTSNRLSRMRSDRQGQTSGRLRFNSVDSDSDGMGDAMGALDVNLRPVRTVPNDLGPVD